MEQAFGNAAAIQRCRWHKRENVVAYLTAPRFPTDYPFTDGPAAAARFTVEMSVAWRPLGEM